jgi:predicted anti-sigma-YlaC factor YlaD
MTNLNCEYIREVYPDVLNGTADAETAAAVHLHIVDCAECRAETELLAQLHAVTVPIPSGLGERVLAAAHEAPHQRHGFGKGRLAMAATVVAAVIGGSLLLDTTRAPQQQTPTVAQTSSSGLGVITVEAAMMSGTGSLQDLTVEELEQLLGEMES